MIRGVVRAVSAVGMVCAAFCFLSLTGRVAAAVVGLVCMVAFCASMIER